LDKIWSNGTWNAVSRASVPFGVNPIVSKLLLKIERDPIRKTKQHKSQFICREFPRIISEISNASSFIDDWS